MHKEIEKKRGFNWGPGLFIIIYHAILLIGLPFYFVCCKTACWQLILCSAILMYLTGLSVTMGYHRLYSHMSYKTKPIVESVLLFFGTMATQGSAVRWSFDHRHHHSFVDTDQDPYSINKGFWYAHFMWLFEKPKTIEKSVVSDLFRNPLTAFQHRHYAILWFVTNIAAVLFFGWAFQDYLGAIVFGLFVRMFFLHHFTWFINSLAHVWGARTFSQELSAVDNYLIALLTFGEGYHNYHHTFASDYRNGIRWFHFDPTKWLIWLLYKCGLAFQLRRMHPAQIEERILLEKKKLLLEKIPASLVQQKEEWEKKISEVIEGIVLKLKQMKKLQETYSELKKKKEEGKELLESLKLESKELKKSFLKEHERWASLSKDLAELS